MRFSSVMQNSQDLTDSNGLKIIRVLRAAIGSWMGSSSKGSAIWVLRCEVPRHRRFFDDDDVR
jgi:hypothetical protein